MCFSKSHILHFWPNISIIWLHVFLKIIPQLKNILLHFCIVAVLYIIAHLNKIKSFKIKRMGQWNSMLAYMSLNKNIHDLSLGINCPKISHLNCPKISHKLLNHVGRWNHATATSKWHLRIKIRLLLTQNCDRSLRSQFCIILHKRMFSTRHYIINDKQKLANKNIRTLLWYTFLRKLKK